MYWPPKDVYEVAPASRLRRGFRSPRSTPPKVERAGRVCALTTRATLKNEQRINRCARMGYPVAQAFVGSNPTPRTMTQLSKAKHHPGVWLQESRFESEIPTSYVGPPLRAFQRTSHEHFRLGTCGLRRPSILCSS